MPETTKMTKDITFHVRRYDPMKDKEPYMQSFQVPVTPGMVLLDGLHHIKENLDPTLALRYSCRMGVCGSCGMLLNGTPTLACNTQILDIATTDLTVAPLPNFHIIKDLVPDLMPMLEKHRAIHPYIHREKPEELNDTTGEHYQTPEQLEHYLQFTYCIKCGCCMAGCPTLATDSEYLGPQPLTQAYRYNADTRDGGRAARNEVTGDTHGAFRCHYAGECSRVCPKGVDPAKAVQLLKRQLVFDYLHLAQKQTPCELLHGPAKGEKMPNIPTAPARTAGV